MAEVFLQTFQDLATQHPSKVAAYRFTDGRWRAVRWDDLWEQCVHAARVLGQLGLQKGDRVALITPISFDYQIADIAVSLAGAILVGMDSHAPIDHIAHYLSTTQANSLIIDRPETLQKIPEAHLKTLRWIVCLKDSPTVARPAGVPFYIWKDIMAAGFLKEERPITLPGPADPNSIVFTAGCEGPSKGALLTHGAGQTAIQVIGDSFFGKVGDVMISWLPTNQMYQRFLNHVGLSTGITVYYLDDPQTILDAARDIRPTFLVSAPRFFEKIYKGLLKKLHQKPFWIRWFFYLGLWLQSTSEEARRSRYHRVKRAWIDQLFFRRFRHRFSRPNFRFMFSIMTHSPRWLIYFFDKIGVVFLNGYGVSENALAIACNRPEDNRFGSVGKIFKGNEVIIAPDGEIWVRGPGLFLRYFQEHNPPKETVVTPDGYFKTGDLGYFDRDGYLYVRGRMDSRFRLSDGTVIFPEEIEGVYREILYIDHVVVTGPGRLYLTALITLDQEALSLDMKRAGVSCPPAESVASSADVRAFLAKDIARSGRVFSPEYRIKDFIILPAPLLVDTGEITPSQKYRRTYIASKYQKALDALYEKNSNEPL